ncbi:MAG: hypothetical protein NTW11_02710 [Candidatus Staskawiczbacteria bacterium]|nr:hypothetical protein [Candidatus Staskawiczbacteria bacterium]
MEEKSEKKVCQNCKNEFVIEPEDFEFYEKMKVPAPTFCPECRTIRRAIFLNHINLYKKTEAKEGKKVFSTYPEEADVKIYDHDYWWSDKWDPMDFGKDIDFGRPFLEQIKELKYNVPTYSRSVRGMVNSDYCANASYLKNCYLCFNANNEENCQYCVGSNYTKDSMDCFASPKSELSYEIYQSAYAFGCLNCSDLESCRNLKFCEECVNCNDCFGCFNLRSKSYYIFNKPYSKEEYFKELGKINFGSYVETKKIKEKFNQFKLKLPRRYIHGVHNKNVSGDYIYASKDTFNCFEVGECENVRYSQQFAPGVKDSYDYTNWGQNSELVYESCSCGDNCQNIKFCFECWPAMQDSEYCLCCHSCSDCFGCVGLRSKQYCILNKQYTKEEYEKLVPEIKKHMADMPYVDSKGIEYRYGEFFPVDFSPLAYNETIAIEYFPKTKEQVEKEGYLWRDKTPGEYKTTMKVSDLPDDIKDVNENILQEVIECDSCKAAFKLIKAELDFYKRFSVPLPRMCFWCRHMERRRKANPLKLWHRHCMKPGCTNEFETSYAPDRPEIVYCEGCYNAEVV